MDEREPVFNLPRVVTVLSLAMIAIHVIRQWVSIDTDNWIIGAFAFIPARYDGYAAELPGGNPAMGWTFLSHAFLHGDSVHLAFNLAWLLAFGGAIAKRTGTLRFLAFFTLSAVAGALTFLILNPGLPVPVVGASGAISGLMGGVMRYLFAALDDGGIAQLRENPKSIQLMTLKETFTDRRVLLATATWLLMNLAAVFGIGTGGASGAIAWEAHIGGFIFGLLTFGLFDLANAKSISTQPSSD